jgi:hypothetical protein
MPRTLRERILLAATLAVAIGAGIYRFSGDADWFGGLSFAGKEIADLQETYEESRMILSREESIQEEFRTIEAQYARTPGLTPEKDFSEKVHGMCVEMGLAPQLSPYEFENIPSVEEYGLIFLPVTFAGQYAKVARLLKNLDAAGFMIDALKITNQKDQDYVSCDLSVARPVKKAEVHSWAPGKGRS